MKMKNKDLIIPLSIGLGMIGLAFIITTAQAEISRDTSAIEGVDYKIFSLGQNPESILLRTDADYEITGYPSTQILVRNWDKLTILEKTTITTELNNMGYFEVVG